MMKKAELVFIPSPGQSHLVSTVEAAKILLDHDDRLSITVLIMHIHEDAAVDTYIHTISSTLDSSSRLRFINLPRTEDPSASEAFNFDLINNHSTPIREAVSNLVKLSSEEDGTEIVGLVLDMFCTKFSEVGQEFGIPSYMFFASSACCLGMFRYLVELRFEQNQDPTRYKDSDEELSIPTLSIPFPAKLLPAVFTGGGFMGEIFLNIMKKIPNMKGIMMNTFVELEPFAVESLLTNDKMPKVYPVGPILNLDGGEQSGGSFDEVKKWLDEQLDRSVVFLCFGTNGSFEEAQVKEFAMALENSGHRFLWSLRKSGQKGTTQEFGNFEEVLPEGFLERTKGVGKVIGWAPQLAVLAHPSVGGFVSHCGWNSTLESIWFGVPIATFPLYAEQQVNAFELVKELGMAEMIKLDYFKSMMGERETEIVCAEEIEAGIRRLMVEGGSGARRKIKEMQCKARSSLLEGGSSYNAQRLFIDDVIRNINT